MWIPEAEFHFCLQNLNIINPSTNISLDAYTYLAQFVSHCRATSGVAPSFAFHIVPPYGAAVSFSLDIFASVLQIVGDDGYKIIGKIRILCGSIIKQYLSAVCLCTCHRQVQWYSGYRASDPRLGEPGFKSCAAI